MVLLKDNIALAHAWLPSVECELNQQHAVVCALLYAQKLQ